jgi:hypothetical protein
VIANNPILGIFLSGKYSAISIQSMPEPGFCHLTKELSHEIDMDYKYYGWIDHNKEDKGALVVINVPDTASYIRG